MNSYEEHDQLIDLAIELRELLFDDANPIMQGAMVGSPVECVAFAKWWIQRAKGLEPDQSHFRIGNPDIFVQEYPTRMETVG